MAAVTAAMVKELRESTGAGMMECKKALTETDGDMEAAVDVLRKSGAAKVEKKAGRIAAEGITRVASDGNTAVVVEVNSETDFVAKNATFQEFVQAVADKALKAPVDKAGDGEDVCAILGMQSELEEKTLTIGEKLSLRRFQKITGDCVASYIHGGGRIGVRDKDTEGVCQDDEGQNKLRGCTQTVNHQGVGCHPRHEGRTHHRTGKSRDTACKGRLLHESVQFPVCKIIQRNA